MHRFIALLVLTSAVGCTSSFDLSRKIPWGGGEDGEFAKPERHVAVWQNTVLHQPGQAPVRGFGGRVFFYDKYGEEDPVKVDGTFEVYAYDETYRDPHNVRPDRKYVFTAEQVQQHYSEARLGHSYSFWIPWGDVNGPPKEISLITRFTPKEGGEAKAGEETRHLLPGRQVVLGQRRRNWKAELASRRGSAVNPGGTDWQSPDNQAGLQVTTLGVPERAGRVMPHTTMRQRRTAARPLPSRPIDRAVMPASAQAPPATGPARPFVGYQPHTRRVAPGPIDRPARDRSLWPSNQSRWPNGPGSRLQAAQAAATGTPAVETVR